MLLLLLVACGQDSGCSGCSDGPPFPDKDRVHSAVQVRLTEPGLSFLEENLEPLLAQALPGGLDICLPGQQGEVDFLIAQVRYGFCADDPCVDNPGQVGCNLNISIGSVDLAAVEPNRLRAQVTFEELRARVPVFADGIIECALLIDGPGFPVQMDLVLETPEPTRDLTFHIEDPVYQLAALNPRLEQGDDGFLSPLCGVISDVLDLPFIGDFILGALQGLVDGFLADTINGFVEDFTCRSCDDENPCPVEGGAVCDAGRCMVEGGCLPAPLGIEGTINIGDLLAGFAPGLDAPLSYLATPGSYAEVEAQGLSLGVIAGATAEPNRCVPRRAQPETDEPMRAEALRTNVDPAGEPYEVGIGITDLILRHFMWAAYTSGALCIGIDSGSVEQLSVDTIGLLLPNLRTLTRGGSALAVVLSPQEVPTAAIGANTVVMDEEDGTLSLDDPLLTIALEDLWIDFHAYFEDRWVRIFSLKADLTLPVGIAFDPDNGLIPVIGDLGSALQNVETANGEIMIDDPGRLAGLLPVLIGPLAGSLTDSLANPIALPDIMGYQLDLQEHSVTGVEDNTMLAVFANLERSEEVNEGMGAAFSVETEVEVAEVHVPPTEDFAIPADLSEWRRPWVRLKLDAYDGTPDSAPMEFSFKVNHGSWSLFTPSTEVVVRDPQLVLQGRHTIQVRARRIDDYRTLDPTPATVRVLIDSVAPVIALTEAAGALAVDVADMVSERAKLVVEWRRDEGPWAALEGDTIPVDGARRVEVRATDEAGNEVVTAWNSAEAPLIGRPPHDARVGEGDGGCGCDVGRSSGSPWMALPFLLLVGLRRRRWALLGLLVLVALGCEDDSKGKAPAADGGMGDARTPDCQTVADCAANQLCDNGTCRVQTCLDDEALCEKVECDSGEPAMCNNMGVCECEPFCAGGCGEDEYCCLARNACEPVPDACADVECDPGFSLMVSDAGQVSEDSCTVEGAQCDCVENEPVDPGWIGRFSDFVVVDGTAWFSAYAEGTGDLVVGPYAPGQGFVWQWVDGVPEGEVVGAPSGPRGGVEEAGENVGWYTAIAAGPEGQLHVAYYDVTNKALKYALGRRAEGGYSWTTQTLDADGDAGRWASISVDARGIPGIAYRMASRAEGEGFVSEVRYKLAKNPEPGAEADWNPTFVLATSPLDAEETFTGTYPEGTGLFTTQVRDRAGSAVVAWYDRTFGQLWWSRFVDAGFSEPALLAGWGHELRDGDMGTNVDLAMDGRGGFHVCYQNGLRDTVMYLAIDGEGAETEDREIDDGVRHSDGREHSVHVVGEDCNMLVDGDGNPVLVYQDSTGHDVVVAQRLGEGENQAWTWRTVLGDENTYRGAFGFYVKAQVVGQQLWISNYVYRHQDDPPTQGLELKVEDLQ